MPTLQEGIDMKTIEELIEKLDHDYQVRSTELERTYQTKRNLLAKDLVVSHVINPTTKRPTITLESDKLEELHHALEVLTPVPAYFVENQMTTDLKKWEERVLVQSDGKKISGLEPIKKAGKFWKMDFPVKLETSPMRSNTSMAKLTWCTEDYCVWFEVPIPFVLNSGEFEAIEEVDSYETGLKRKYNNMALQPVYHIVHVLRNTTPWDDNGKGIVRADFSGGHKYHFSITPEGTQRMLSVLGLKGGIFDVQD